MKKLIVLFMMIVMVSGLMAQTSVATTDNFMAAKLNPAAMGYGNAGGVGLVFPYENDVDIDKTFDLYLNGENGGYLMSKNGDFYLHRITSVNNFKNFNFGIAWDWDNSNFWEGEIEASTLYRPFDALSLGFVINDLDKYRAGAGFRPTFLGNKFGNRITLTADVNYEEEFENPVLGIETELLDGITVGGSYNLDSEDFGVNFGINFGKFSVGSFGTVTDDKKYENAQHYVAVSDKVFPSLLYKKRSNGVHDFKIRGAVVERNQAQRFGNIVIFNDKNTSLESLLAKIEKLKNDETIEAIVFKKNSINASFANLVEIRKALLDFKTSGKKVIFYNESYGNLSYAFAASVADEIYLYKTGSIDLRGISINSPYLKNLMDKVGVKMENFRSHKYKTAGNMFVESEMTEAERESYSYVLDGLYDEMKNMISAGRGDKLKFSAEETINNGPYFIAENALENGLVDGLIYEDELEDILSKQFKNGKITSKLAEEKANVDWAKSKEEKVAVIFAIGNIHMGEGQPGKSIGSETTSNAIRKARKDKSVKGIILCVNSGGGSALASDIIGREIELCKTSRDKKPVVALMTGTAASGGYYISANADKIIAQPTTITGSIGVIGMLFNLEGLYEKIGVNWSTVKKGNFSDLGNSSRALTDEEKKIIKESIENTYWQFIDVVAKGRKLSKDEVHEIARGRIWTGKQAMDRGLVDMMGGMEKAVEEIKTLANIKNDVKIIEYTGYDKSKTIQLNLDMQMSLPNQLQMIKDIGDEMQMYKGERVLMLMPKIEIR